MFLAEQKRARAQKQEKIRVEINQMLDGAENRFATMVEEDFNELEIGIPRTPSPSVDGFAERMEGLEDHLKKRSEEVIRSLHALEDRTQELEQTVKDSMTATVLIEAVHRLTAVSGIIHRLIKETQNQNQNQNQNQDRNWDWDEKGISQSKTSSKPSLKGSC